MLVLMNMKGKYGLYEARSCMFCYLKLFWIVRFFEASAFRGSQRSALTGSSGEAEACCYKPSESDHGRW